ncbi:hypothetical protein E4198_20765 [Streptomyces sp. RKND-216]|uniref:hypothetical protein n=1 Tax=Streptomyces sp. RKND-216 TaxID=2562581 RepID=UPI00109D8496|nr:hypothetical protein [Streptomyces sp. RKND-216]THA26772.1 hypothetical protein E4198_20765 [Streptomyces sp. RKND-216]
MQIVLTSPRGEVKCVAHAPTHWFPPPPQMPLDVRLADALHETGVATVERKLDILGECVEGGDSLFDRCLANTADPNLDHAQRPARVDGHRRFSGQRLAYGPALRLADLLEQTQLLRAV